MPQQVRRLVRLVERIDADAEQACWVACSTAQRDPEPWQHACCTLHGCPGLLLGAGAFHLAGHEPVEPFTFLEHCRQKYPCLVVPVLDETIGIGEHHGGGGLGKDLMWLERPEWCCFLRHVASFLRSGLRSGWVQPRSVHARPLWNDVKQRIIHGQVRGTAITCRWLALLQLQEGDPAAHRLSARQGATFSQ